MMTINQSKRYFFSFPHEVVDHPSLSLSQKRAILAEWASDACAIESFPVLRLLPGTSFPVTFSSIMDARAYLDRKYGEEQDAYGQTIAWLLNLPEGRWKVSIGHQANSWS